MNGNHGGTRDSAIQGSSPCPSINKQIHMPEEKTKNDEKATENFTFVIDKATKSEMMSVCEDNDMYMAQFVRRAIRQALDRLRNL